MKKATVAAVAEAKSDGPSLPRKVSIEVDIWQCRINRAKNHSLSYQPWCKAGIRFMEDWMSLLPARRHQG